MFDFGAGLIDVGATSIRPAFRAVLRIPPDACAGRDAQEDPWMACYMDGWQADAH